MRLSDLIVTSIEVIVIGVTKDKAAKLNFVARGYTNLTWDL